MKLIYELYTCGPHRMICDLNVSSRLIISDDEELTKDTIVYVMEREPGEEVKKFRHMSREELSRAVKERHVSFLHYNEVELNEYMD